MAIKLILEALRETKDPEAKYLLTKAHNELIKNTFQMMYEQRIESAKTGVEIIKKYSFSKL